MESTVKKLINDTQDINSSDDYSIALLYRDLKEKEKNFYEAINKDSYKEVKRNYQIIKTLATSIAILRGLI